MKPWYEELFENYGMKYDNESFVQGTRGECDFIEKEIAHNKKKQNSRQRLRHGQTCH